MLYTQLCWYCCAGLMAANLAGFVVGAAGLKPLLADMLSRPAFVAATLTVFFSAAQVCAHPILQPKCARRALMFDCQDVL